METISNTRPFEYRREITTGRSAGLIETRETAKYQTKMWDEMCKSSKMRRTRFQPESPLFKSVRGSDILNEYFFTHTQY